MKWQKYKKNHCISIRLYLTFFWTGREGMYCTIPNYQDLPTNYQQPASNFRRRRAIRFTRLRGSVRLVPAPIPPAGPKNKKREAVVAPLSFHITRKNYLCEMLTL